MIFYGGGQGRRVPVYYSFTKRKRDPALLIPLPPPPGEAEGPPSGRGRRQGHQVGLNVTCSRYLTPHPPLVLNREPLFPQRPPPPRPGQGPDPGL